jgi:hypothetical protein
MVQGLAELGPFPAPGDDLSLELGLSIWLQESGAELEEAREAMFEVRGLVLEVAGLDPRTEPVPFVGRSLEADLVLLASYMDDLMVRAALAAECSPELVAERVVARLRDGQLVGVGSGPFRPAPIHALHP